MPLTAGKEWREGGWRLTWVPLRNKHTHMHILSMLLIPREGTRGGEGGELTQNRWRDGGEAVVVVVLRDGGGVGVEHFKDKGRGRVRR